MAETKTDLLARVKKLGERQYGYDLAQIKPDHVQRYRWAAKGVGGKLTIDAGCGVGYGSRILVEEGEAKHVHAVDVSQVAIDFAREFWPHEKITYERRDLHSLRVGMVEALVCLECIEHLVAPEILLMRLWRPGLVAFLSSPNADVEPERVKSNPFHIRHYTAQEFASLCERSGYRVEKIESQVGPPYSAKIEDNLKGRFLLITASAAKAPNEAELHAAEESYPERLHKEMIKRCQVIRKLRSGA